MGNLFIMHVPTPHPRTAPMLCQFIESRPMTFTREDGTTITREVFGYVCGQPTITPTADACADHIDQSCWGQAA